MEYSVRTIIELLIPAIIAMVASEWIYGKVLRIAKALNITDKPNARKVQTEPTPVMGGLVVFFGLMVGVLLSVYFFGEIRNLTPVISAAAILLLVGFADDILDLNPWIRLFIESLTILGLCFGADMCVDSFHGMWGIHNFSWYIGIPLTVFASVGIINAFNMVDGINGLSSGLCITCSILLSIIFYKSADPVNAALAICFAAALIPFFLHNVFGKTSKMFIGDSGTMVMGLLVSWFVIRCMNQNGLSFLKEQEGIIMNMAAMLLAVVSVPVFDAIRVMIMRICKGKSPMHADKTHLHHAFLTRGISHIAITTIEILMNISVVLIWYLSYKMGANLDWQMYSTIISASIIIGGAYLILSIINKKKNT